MFERVADDLFQPVEILIHSHDVGPSGLPIDVYRTSDLVYVVANSSDGHFEPVNRFAVWDDEGFIHISKGGRLLKGRPGHVMSGCGAFDLVVFVGGVEAANRDFSLIERFLVVPFVLLAVKGFEVLDLPFRSLVCNTLGFEERRLGLHLCVWVRHRKGDLKGVSPFASGVLGTDFFLSGHRNAYLHVGAQSSKTVTIAKCARLNFRLRFGCAGGVAPARFPRIVLTSKAGVFRI